MSKLERSILAAMIVTGRAAAGWRIKVTGTATANGGDWATVSANVTRPKCKKPCIAWEIAIYMPREQIRWDKSTFEIL